MHRMVDNLLEPPSSRNTTSNETSYGMHSATANEVFAPLTSSGFEPRFNGTPKMLPSLPGFYNSAFTPQPNELQPLSPNRPMSARQSSPLSLATPEQRLQAAMALDEVTGYRPTKSGSWGRKASGPLSNLISQPVNQILQESLAQQFMTMPSSAFSESSSIYANNTPQEQYHAGVGAWRGGLPPINGNNSTIYPGASDFDKTTMLQSSIYDDSQPAFGGYAQHATWRTRWLRYSLMSSSVLSKHLSMKHTYSSNRPCTLDSISTIIYMTRLAGRSSSIIFTSTAHHWSRHEYA
jgi:hypothetical protein